MLFMHKFGTFARPYSRWNSYQQLFQNFDSFLSPFWIRFLIKLAASDCSMIVKMTVIVLRFVYVENWIQHFNSSSC